MYKAQLIYLRLNSSLGNEDGFIYLQTDGRGGISRSQSDIDKSIILKFNDFRTKRPNSSGSYNNNNNNNLFEKQQNKWLVPQIVTKLIEAGQDEYRNTLEK